jgi:molybdopterin-guanine dinucleotide biosynthesis protein A
MPIMSHGVAVVILAGGGGRRIGGGKPLLRLRGERLVDHALRNARRWSECVAVSARRRAQIKPVDAPIIIDDPDIAGPLGGLISALLFGAKSGREFVLTIPADMPFLPPDLLDRLKSEIEHSGCAIASSGGHLHPVCGLWRSSAFDRVGRYLAGEKRSLKAFASLIGLREVEWPCDPLDPFFNINTAGELAEAERRAAD